MDSRGLNIKVISRNVGYALLVSALFMLLSVFVSFLDGKDSALAPLLISFIITFIVGIFPFIFVRNNPRISLKDGYLIIILSWLLSFIFGMLPYLLWGGPFTVVNAWFESVSGFTTTGATILEDIEVLPRSLLFWRSSTHFIGGLGVVVFLLLIIPSSSPVKLRLANMELSSLSKEEYQSRTDKTVRIFTDVYILMNLAAFVMYLLAGMDTFDALCHALSVCATGGFSTKNLSIGAFNSVPINLITMFFMLISSIHFGLLYMIFATRSLRPLNNPVLKLYLSTLVVASLLVSLALRTEGIVDSFPTALMQGSFQVLCYASTAGFAIADNATWSIFPCIILVIVGIMCGMAGSTTGGVKSDRVLLLSKAISKQVKSSLYPSTVSGVRFGGKTLQESEVYPHVLYIAVYFLFVIVSALLCLLVGDDSSNAITGSIASLSNVGPAIGQTIGSMGNFNMEPAGAKVIFTLDMFLGRLEIYPVMAVIYMIFKPKG